MKSFNEFCSKDSVYESIGALACKLDAAGASPDEAFRYIMDNLIIVADADAVEKIMLLEADAPNIHQNMVDKFGRGVGRVAGHVVGAVKRGWDQMKNSFGDQQSRAMDWHHEEPETYKNAEDQVYFKQQQDAMRNTVAKLQPSYGTKVVNNESDINFNKMKEMWNSGDLIGMKDYMMKNKLVLEPRGIKPDDFFGNPPHVKNPMEKTNVPSPWASPAATPPAPAMNPSQGYSNGNGIQGNESVDYNKEMIYTIMTAFDVADNSGLINEFLKIAKNV